jgi:hypothetical protein
MSDSDSPTQEMPVIEQPSLIQPTSADALPVKEGVRSIGDAMMMVFDARNTDPFLYVIQVDLHPKSKPGGIIGGLVHLLQMPRVNLDKPNEWVAFEIYECPKDGCDGILTDDLRKNLYWMCPKCGQLATVDEEQVPVGGKYEDLQVRKVGHKWYAFGAQVWGDVLAEYVQRVWRMRKTSGEAGYRAMVLVRRPRSLLQNLTRDFVESHKAVDEAKLIKGTSTQFDTGPEYSLYGPDAIERDLKPGGSLAKRMQVFIRGG